MSDPAPKPVRFGDLGLRTVSGLVLAAVSFLCVWAGGALAALYVAAALAVLLWEYHAMLSGEARGMRPPLAAMLAGGAAAVLATGFGALAVGFACLLVGTLVAALLAGSRFVWLAGGTLYIGIALCGLLVVRDRPDGFALVLWLVAVVIAADVGAYFVGRRVGGPKLWPRVSPGKTRSGAVGGLACAAAVGLDADRAVSRSSSTRFRRPVAHPTRSAPAMARFRQCPSACQERGVPLARNLSPAKTG
jgi:phosphatidate cytidylyltransferase